MHCLLCCTLSIDRQLEDILETPRNTADYKSYYVDWRTKKFHGATITSLLAENGVIRYWQLSGGPVDPAQVLQTSPVGQTTEDYNAIAQA